VQETLIELPDAPPEQPVALTGEMLWTVTP